MRADRPHQLAVALALLQSLDTAGNVVVPRARLDAHFDHLGVPPPLRRLLQPVKVASSLALLAARRRPRLRAATAAGLVAYYAAAARFHLLAGDHPVVSLPAAGLGALAAAVVATTPVGPVPDDERGAPQ